MHAYATDSEERKTVLLILVGLAILLAWLLNRVLAAADVTVPWWIDAPSVVGFYGIAYWLWDNWAWSRPLFKRIGLVKVPNLTGTWKGVIQSSFDNRDSKQPVSVTICQQWSTISVVLSTTSSKSHSVGGTLLTKAPGGTALNYEYLNEPVSGAKATMNMHRGTARLVLSGDTLEGDYYTGRGRQNFGSLVLTKG